MSHRALSVLVVEDDPALRQLVVDVFEGLAWEVSGAENGAVALEKMRHCNGFDVILLDMKMPVMSGWEFAAMFHERCGHAVPVVVFTAAADAKQRALEVDAEAWVSKPFELSELTDTVSRAAGMAG